VTARKVSIIVQARSGSSRLPHKIHMPFGGTTLLQHILRRLHIGASSASGVSGVNGWDVWVATTDQPDDDRVVEACKTESVPCVRGSVDNVLQRFVTCLEAMPTRPDLVVRICADRPFICTRLLSEMLEFYEEIGAPDYLCNNRPRSFPNGLDLEICKTATLYEALASDPDEIEREHVTPHIYNHPEKFSLSNYVCPFGNFARARMVVDTQLDYDTLLAAQETLAALRLDYDYRDILNYVTLYPERLEANQDVPQFGVSA
jgi:spore coat polysaccharide biosynthesis protein SpsF (cytidylyltransferase family)